MWEGLCSARGSCKLYSLSLPSMSMFLPDPFSLVKVSGLCVSLSS